MSAGQVSAILRVVNTSGVVGVLLLAVWLGLRGDVVTASQLSDCQMSRDAYLQGWLRALDARDPEWRPLPPDTPVTPGRPP